ncbi:MAG: heavy metal-binding domain-containing protein [Geminicoccaceae bacterium]|nr:heavy metal-binding domain-containing protein [Geminicoccaceae bacterium]
MLVSTTNTLEGHRVREYRGLVAGEAILGTNFVRDFFANIRDVVGGRSGGYEKGLREAREIAVKEMCDKAKDLGANAVIGVDIDYETVGEKGSMLMVTAAGTAVVVD